MRIHAFDDVDFSVVGPIGSDCPPGWPGSTAGRHMVEIENVESVGVGLGGSDSDAVSTSSGGRDDGRVVRSHDEGITVHY